MRAILPKIGFVWKDLKLFRDKSEKKMTANKSRDDSYTDTFRIKLAKPFYASLGFQTV
jgi:hypothetical protein